jgi:hypothetical protein
MDSGSREGVLNHRLLRPYRWHFTTEGPENYNNEAAEGARGTRGQPRYSYYRQTTRRRNPV